jgi:hypothetical protein
MMRWRRPSSTLRIRSPQAQANCVDASSDHDGASLTTSSTRSVSTGEPSGVRTLDDDWDSVGSMADVGDLPPLAVLVDGADAMLPESVRAWVPMEQRRSALSKELSWWLDVAAQDMGYARDYRAVAPVAGAQDEDYLDRWLQVSEELWVLAGPRFRALDLDTPFVGFSGASRAITEHDLPGLRRLARTEFELFRPRYATVWSGLPAGAWPQTRADSRLLVARLGTLRARSVPGELKRRALTDLSFYEDYVALYDQHRALRPAHRVQARPEPARDLAGLVRAGTAWRPRSRARSRGYSPPVPVSRADAAARRSSSSSSHPASAAGATAPH